MVLQAGAEAHSNCLLDQEGICCLVPIGLCGGSSHQHLDKEQAGMDMVAMPDKHGREASVLDLGPLSCVFFDDAGVQVQASVLEEVVLLALDQHG